MTETVRFTRRALIAGAGLAAAAGLTAHIPAVARAPLTNRQVAGFYRLRVGAFEVTALLDGHLPLGHDMFTGATQERAARLQFESFLPPGPVATPVNAYAVNTGERLILIDTGTATVMGPGLGLVPANLQAAGIDPAQVDMVVLTHLHPDHANGLVGQGGASLFPNAEVLVASAELAFWRDDAVMAQAPEQARAFFQMARAAIAPYAARLRPITPGGEIAPGIVTVPLPGHTPGHLGVRIVSGDAQLLVWGDTVHVAVYQFAEPGWTIGFDVDQPAAAASRRRAMDMAATDRLLIAGMHVPFPGVGFVERAGTGYRFVPVPWAPL